VAVQSLASRLVWMYWLGWECGTVARPVGRWALNSSYLFNRNTVGVCRHLGSLIAAAQCVCADLCQLCQQHTLDLHHRGPFSVCNFYEIEAANKRAAMLSAALAVCPLKCRFECWPGRMRIGKLNVLCGGTCRALSLAVRR